MVEKPVGSLPTDARRNAAPDISSFRDTVYAYYSAHGREFPWRHTRDPYRILVSEVMLQQTQTSRVVSKYVEFLCHFPNCASLARATVADVLRVWHGMGYNRRALALRRVAQQVMELYDGRLPEDRDKLLDLPGVGPYTASAVRAFAFNRPDAFIETNIRTVFIHHFFTGEDWVDDRDIMPFVTATVDKSNPRRWYEALMDYGAMLKETDNAARRSAHHRPQSRFAGSRREARGRLIGTLLETGPTTQERLESFIGQWDDLHEAALAALVRDGLVKKDRATLSLD